MAEQWLTYQQAGALLGMTAEAARQRARRLKWRTQPGNDGKALVLVPPDQSGVRPRVRPAVQPAAILRDELDHERARREAAQAAAAGAMERAARAEGEATALQAALTHERTMREVAEIARDAARQEAAEWQAGGPFARAWRALVYRRDK